MSQRRSADVPHRPRAKRRERGRFALSIALLTVAAVAGAAEPDRRPGWEGFLVETDATAEKKLATVAEYVARREWTPAVALLREVAAASPNALIRVSPDRSVAVPRFCDIVLSRLPSEGLEAYRRGIDPQAAAWLAEADATGDPRPLRAIAERATLSSVGDDAAWRLAGLAWERGDLPLARRYWTLLLPLGAVADAEPPAVLRYPDADVADAAAIRARLVLCSIAEGELDRARREIASFRDLHPDAAGSLGGHDGPYAETLAAALTAAIGTSSEPPVWDALPPTPATTTFAASAARAGRTSSAPETLTPVWSRPLPPSLFAPPNPRPALPDFGPLASFPVVWRDKAFAATAERVYGFDLATGRPAWPAGEQDAGVLFPPAAGDEPDAAGPPSAMLVGTPRHTLTVAGDALYARIGSPVTDRPAADLRRSESALVRLDLGREGSLAWRVSSRSLGPEDERWNFEGPPAAEGGRLYAVASRGRPQPQLAAVCLDAATGAVLWNRTLGAPVAAPPEGVALMTHRLAAVAGGKVYVATGYGAVVCLDADDGRPTWVGWLDRPARRSVAEDLVASPEACLVASGVVVATSSDGRSVAAHDAASGVRLWDREVRGGAPQLVGAADGVLVVSGRRLVGFDLRTGRELWTVGYEDPPGFGAGRGLIAAGRVYWPTREELFVIDSATGRPHRRVPLKDLFGLAGGGNLAASADRLLLARPDGLVAFGR